MSAFSAADIAAKLKLHRSRDEWRGDCPVCDYGASFTLSVGKSGRPIGWCASCANSREIAALLAELCGGAPAPVRSDWTPRVYGAGDVQQRLGWALDLWNSSALVSGTIAERYLDSRGVVHIAASSALRFHSCCPHPNSRERLPALIAIVQGADGGPHGIHRTYLRRDGSGKAAIDPPRASLGPVRGGSVRLDPVADELVIGEGLETSASASLLLGLPAWSALSCGNLADGLVLPVSVRSIVIAADPDPQGKAAAATARQRWMSEGRRVRVITPNNGDEDFNDLLLRRRARGDASS